MKELVCECVSSHDDITKIMNNVLKSIRKEKEGLYITDLKKQISSVLSILESYPQEEELIGICNWRLYEEKGKVAEIVSAGMHGLAPSFEGYLKFCEIQKQYPDDDLLPKIYHYRKFVVWQALEQVDSYIKYKKILSKYPNLKQEGFTYETDFGYLLDGLENQSLVIEFLNEYPQLQGVFANPTLKQLEYRLQLTKLLEQDERIAKYFFTETVFAGANDPSENYLAKLIEKIFKLRIVLKLCDNDLDVALFVGSLDTLDPFEKLRAINIRRDIIGLMKKYENKYPELLKYDYLLRLGEKHIKSELANHIRILKMIKIHDTRGSHIFRDLYEDKIKEGVSEVLWYFNKQIRENKQKESE